MKKIRKFGAVGLAIMMAASLAGCGSSKEDGSVASGTQSEPASAQSEAADAQTEAGDSGAVSQEASDGEAVTLEWYYRGNGIQKDTEMVEEAFNELLKTYPGMENVTVNFNCYTGDEYSNAVILSQSADKQIDILNTVGLDFAEEVEKGTYLPLNDMLAENETLKSTLPDWLWDLGSIDGNIYIVPNYQRAANLMYLTTPKEYMDNYGDKEKIESVIQNPDSTVEEIAAVLEEYCQAVQAGEGATKYMPPLATMYYSQYGFMDNFDKINGEFIAFSKDNKVVDQYLYDEVKEAYRISGEWYEKGYIHPDIMTISPSDFQAGNMMNEVSYIFCVNNQAGDEEKVSDYYSQSYGFDTYAIPIKTNYYITNTWSAGGNGVTAKCKHPDKALRLIELMTTEEGKDLYNMMVYGIEGVHYEKIDDTHIQTLEYDGTQGGVDTSYAGIKWIIGNTFNAYLNQGCVDGDNELALEINNSEDNEISNLMGFNASVENISTQLEQISAVSQEYASSLYNGALGSGWEDQYNAYLEKMENAGLNEVLTELQSQVDAFLAGQSE